MGKKSEWKFNAWTGNSILSIPEYGGRIVREQWGPGQYRYTAEYWGDYSLRYPIYEYRHTTLIAAKDALRKLQIENTTE